MTDTRTEPRTAHRLDRDHPIVLDITRITFMAVIVGAAQIWVGLEAPAAQVVLLMAGATILANANRRGAVALWDHGAHRALRRWCYAPGNAAFMTVTILLLNGEPASLTRTAIVVAGGAAFGAASMALRAMRRRVTRAEPAWRNLEPRRSTRLILWLASILAVAPTLWMAAQGRSGVGLVFDLPLISMIERPAEPTGCGESLGYAAGITLLSGSVIVS